MKPTLLIGTTKGAFILTRKSSDWEVSGPHCGGWPINHIVGEGDRLWAGGGNDFYGAAVWRSEDGGETWKVARLSPGGVDAWFEQDPSVGEFFPWISSPIGTDLPLDAVWALRHAHGVLYAGTKPAELLASRDGGESWQPNAAFRDFDGRADWNGGAAGLVLHSLVPHPDDAQRMWIGGSSIGVFATEDGGARWERRNRLTNAALCEGHTHPAAPANGETGHCVHNMQRAPGAADVLYQQNHHGVWRSNDGGRSWDDATEGLPSTFGFPIGMHPRDPKTIWVLPLNGDSAGRYPPDAQAAVWKSTDGGESWAPKRAGLPQKACFFTVLRQAMAVDRSEPAGVYFGTNTGSVFASEDEGETWAEATAHLPTILSVEVLH